MIPSCTTLNAGKNIRSHKMWLHNSPWKIDRLLELNRNRYAEEVAQCLHDKKKAKKRDAGSVKRGAKKTTAKKAETNYMFGG